MNRKLLLAVSMLVLILAVSFVGQAKTYKFWLDEDTVGPVTFVDDTKLDLELQVRNGSAQISAESPNYTNTAKVEGTFHFEETATLGKIEQETELSGSLDSKTIAGDTTVTLLAVTDDGFVEHKVKVSEIEKGNIKMIVQAEGEDGWIVVKDTREAPETTIEAMVARYLGVGLEEARDLCEKYGENRAKYALRTADGIDEFWQKFKGVKIVFTIKDSQMFAKIFFEGEEVTDLRPVFGLCQGHNMLLLNAVHYSDKHNAYYLDIKKRIQNSWLKESSEDVYELPPGEYEVTLAQNGFDHIEKKVLIDQQGNVVEKHKGDSLHFEVTPKGIPETIEGVTLNVLNNGTETNTVQGTVTILRNGEKISTSNIPKVTIEPGEEKKGRLSWKKISDIESKPGFYRLIFVLQTKQQKVLSTIEFTVQK